MLRTYLLRIFLFCLNFYLYFASSSANTTVTTTSATTTILTQNKLTTRSSIPKNLKESYEEYEGNSDRDLFFDTFKVYDDDGSIEKGIRKLDTSFENTDKLESNEELKPKTNSTEIKTLKIPVFLPSSSESFLLPSAEDESIDRSDNISANHNDEDESIIFEDSELNNRSPNISGTLVTKLIPEILKYNGRMVMPTSEEQLLEDQNKGAANESNNVVQKLSSLRKVRQDSSPESTDLSVSYYAHNLSRLENIFDIYNPYRLLEIWEDNNELERMTSLCRSQMETFLIALKHGEVWAIKSK